MHNNHLINFFMFLPLKKPPFVPFCRNMSGLKVWDVKLSLSSFPMHSHLSPNCLFLLVVMCVLDKMSIYNLQKEGPPSGSTICHLGTCRALSLVLNKIKTLQ